MSEENKAPQSQPDKPEANSARPAGKQPAAKKVPKKKDPVELYQLTVEGAPHLKSKASTSRIMIAVSLALVPALVGAVIFQGWRSLMLVLIAVVSCMAFEAAIQLLTKRKLTIADGSAALTGVLLAFNLPYNVPWWLPVVGSFAAIAIAKQAFGGLGYNLFNPALVGRAILLASWPVHMTSDWSPLPRLANLSGTSIDALSSATPLAVMKHSSAVLANPAAHDPGAVSQATQAVEQLTGPAGTAKLALGQVGGCIGETSALLLLVGALLLIMINVVDWRIPLSYLATIFVFTAVFGGVTTPDGAFHFTGLFHLLAGGAMLGALFMATDMVTTPVTKKGRIIFGVGAGLLAAIIRLWGGYPEGVSYSILLMNAATPLIDRYTVPRFFGQRRSKEAANA